jgi:hypothetical protein
VQKDQHDEDDAGQHQHHVEDELDHHFSCARRPAARTGLLPTSLTDG